MLPLKDYRRYGRQMILEGFGLPGQVKLKEASVVVVGAGGLGCPALQYLAASGIGRIGVIDHDVVELSNLHRQILHTETTIGMPKALSAAKAISVINPQSKVEAVVQALSPTNATELLAPYDVILDCTDNAPTRYLLSDVAVALRKPLVSGAAQRFEGQLCIYNYGENGPCYRCLFPKPPAQETVGTCEETGILGAVTGIIGNLQALETIKIIAGLKDQAPSLLLFNALQTPPFRSIKLRNKKPACAACGSGAKTRGMIDNTDYVQFCGGPPANWVERGLVPGSAETRISTKDLHRILATEVPTLIDVRPRTEYGICHLPNSLNIPLNELVSNPKAAMPEGAKDIYILCRLGNDSQIAADALREVSTAPVKDIIGGLVSWAQDVDSSFPVY
ncbi:Urmylation protein [Pleurotus ostreatus]|uniref:Needs CLA4 to survive protein 3 n=1 Tax=Pleurotus ostreatus TaxID=5322 RepID=A0A8H7DS92_PLEOS|nr:Urmylation protein [Pleurotus ostreatus]KAF7424316.1 Urmylation protein [Pleurotus ostreatus]